MISLSIIIPVTRVSDFSNLISKLTEQLKDFDEIIGIIDSSKKDFDFLSKKLLGNKNITLLYSGGKKGPAYCRNIGIKKAENPYIVLFDDDIIPSKTVISDYKNLFEKNPDKFGICGNIRLFSTRNTLTSFYLKKHDQVFGSDQSILELCVIMNYRGSHPAY